MNVPLRKSRGDAGTADAPAADAVVAEVTALAPGIYRVRVATVLSGTAETAETNLRLQTRVGSAGATTTVSDLLSLKDQVIEAIFDRVELTAENSEIEVAAVAAATAGSIYNVQLVVERIA